MKFHIDAIPYHAYTAGRVAAAARDTLIFVHGTAMDHTVWNLQSRYFAYHGYNVLALNLPGHGFSSGAALSSIEALGDWVQQAIAHSTGAGFHLVGHSMGALVALQAAATWSSPQPLRSLTLVGFSYPMTVAPKLLAAAKHNPRAAYAMMTQWSYTSSLGGEPNPGFWSPGVQMSMLENSRPGVVYTDLCACNEYANGEQALPLVACPVLFISGRRDKMAPCKLAQQHAARHKSSEVALIDNAGHSVMAEKPDAVLAELKRFIGQNLE